MKKLIALTWLLLQLNFGFSQSIKDVEFRKIETTNVGELSSSFVIHITDSVQIDKIEVDLGSNDGLSNLINQDFDFDIVTGLPNGFSYTRTGNSIVLETGIIPEYPTFFGRARLKLSNGLYSPYFSFTSN
ncbi:MAG: hypothetical protein IPK10_15300 [Bacteroidetes bacterium]|nr:hypothetical protein [Bacteroidota bacterium]